MEKLCLGAFLLFQAILDGKTGKVHLLLLLAQAGAGLGLGCLSGLSGTDQWSRFLPGLCLLGAAYASGEKIGAGDGWLFLALGVYLTAIQQVILFSWAVFLAGLWTIPLFLLQRVEKDTALPFVPFVLFVYAGGVFYGWF